MKNFAIKTRQDLEIFKKKYYSQKRMKMNLAQCVFQNDKQKIKESKNEKR